MQYNCVVQLEKLGSMYHSDHYYLWCCVYMIAHTAQILIHPNQTTEVDAYNTVIVACVVYGVPSPSITWNRGNTELTNDSSQVTIYEMPITHSASEITFIQSILELCWAEEEDAGEYSCFSENMFGNDTATFNLTVNARGKLTLLSHDCYNAV